MRKLIIVLIAFFLLDWVCNGWKYACKEAKQAWRDRHTIIEDLL